MKEEYNDYDDARYDDEYDDQMPDNKAVRGYRIVIIILAVILVALSALYFRIHRQQQAEYVLLEEDRNKIQNDLDSLMSAAMQPNAGTLLASAELTPSSDSDTRKQQATLVA